MRTTSNAFDKSLRDIGLELVRVISGQPQVYDRNYGVDGVIIFWLDCGLEGAEAFNIEPLRSAILETDKQFPWLDEVLPGDTYQSIRYLSVGETLTHRCNPARRTVSCVFKLEPYRSMRRTQIHAYERYLYNLGQKLSEKGLSGVIEIDVHARWFTHKTFK